MADSELEFFESLPRTRGAASALLRDDGGRVLVVKPTYRPGWGLPGGVIEMGESPLAACRRECVEELGFVPVLEHLVCVDWLPPTVSPDRRPATIFVFSGKLEPGDFDRVRLPPEELADARMATAEDLGALLPANQARRIRACLRGEAVHYLEHGFAAAWTS
ncbi:NUDIX domain-containing protein [Nocardiopsis ansamitocini]|uniref:Nudix hydrolase domain-containing protein n=1 Tax=Nocardiopsis ansamitocini TaxID=1670832 RepID=A0A9W6P7A6_9ACTN|nr:NUDIX hydrolase [Nocardiopsis ansamitocini]GLU48446.1 hypothetical protein Nans01_27970 [Nocardiopsis ansamitocini]